MQKITSVARGFCADCQFLLDHWPEDVEKVDWGLGDSTVA
jgi:hypothetical protein